MKIKIINGIGDELQESKVNDFIKDKKLIDIKATYQDNETIENLALIIMYEESEG